MIRAMWVERRTETGHSVCWKGQHEKGGDEMRYKRHGKTKVTNSKKVMVGKHTERT